MQGDFYTQGANGEKGHQAFSMQKAIDEHPTYVVFNGATNSLTGEQALKAKKGEKVRFFVGNGGPNLVSSFHLIGEIFDSVYLEGGTGTPANNIQTTIVPAGGSSIVEFIADVPGTFVIVDHSLFRAFNKGALGLLKIDGPEDKSIYSGKEVDETYLGAQADVAASSGEEKKLRKDYDEAVKDNPQLQKLSKEILMAQGKKVYSNNCLMCHQTNGEGIAAVFPPLANSDYMQKLAAAKDRSGLIRIPIHGMTGKITVNGKEYNSVMPALSGLANEDIASVLTYITNSWGNTAKPFSLAEVQTARSDAVSQDASAGHE